MFIADHFIIEANIRPLTGSGYCFVFLLQTFVSYGDALFSGNYQPKADAPLEHLKHLSR